MNSQNKKYFITFGNQNFSKQIERLKEESLTVNWFDGCVFESPKTIQNFYNKHKTFIDANPTGWGYWIWKPYIILRQLHEMEEGDFLFYTDAGASILPHRKYRLDEYIEILNQSPRPILTFYIPDYKEKFLQKSASLRKFSKDGVSLENNEKFLESGQIESGIFICKKTPFAINFVQSWLDNLLENNYELAHDFDCNGQYRHDQSILSILCKIHDTNILPGTEAYGMGPFFSSRMVDEGQRIKGPDLYRSQIGYNFDNPKHDTWGNWLADSDYIHYFIIPNLGFFIGKFDSISKTLKETKLISDFIPQKRFDFYEFDKVDLARIAEEYIKQLPK